MSVKAVDLSRQLQNENESSLYIKNTSIEIGDKIGSGNNANIFMGYYKDLSIKIAIKVEKSAKNLKCLNQTINELVGEMKSINHENVIRVYGVCPVKNDVNLVIMELADPRGSLRTFLNKKSIEIFDNIKIRWLKQIANGMSFLHSKDIIHRDLKTENIVMNNYPYNIDKLEETVLKIIDISRSGGTPTHMSPEAFEEKYCKKSDVWSYGCVAWEIMTQLNPKEYFKNANLFQIATGQFRMKSNEIEDQSIKYLVDNCWEHNIEKRMNFGQICTRLDELISDIRPTENFALNLLSIRQKSLETEYSSNNYLNNIYSSSNNYSSLDARSFPESGRIANIMLKPKILENYFEVESIKIFILP
ncbi:unnamed protein product [Brachionus calyciflorus]|uniref:Protein kinase domain-containing protein n=1 Tax=Brachionus calyciflorus TaxID=104777 RepID=A0A814NES7_9BILA|nr:unnamed protein product [Brachionus calyciflorus]